MTPVTHARARYGGSDCCVTSREDRCTDRLEAVTCSRCRWLALARIDVEDGPRVARDVAEACGWLPERRAA